MTATMRDNEECIGLRRCAVIFWREGPAVKMSPLTVRIRSQETQNTAIYSTVHIQAVKSKCNIIYSIYEKSTGQCLNDMINTYNIKEALTGINGV